jgi:NhaP-type Na+/H+ or K+/H+ antiporter
MNKIPWIEIGIFVMASYFPYILAEGLECSGLLAILIMAIIMRNYCFHSLSPVGTISIEFLVEMACNISENFVFCYLGISIPLMITDVKPSLIVVGIVALMVSRFVSIFLTFTIINLFKTKERKMPFSWTIVMTWGGLRGAIAFYLALNMNSEYKNLIITTTMSLCIFTIVGLGSTTTLIIKLCLKLFPGDALLEPKPQEGEGAALMEDQNYN